MSGHLQKEADFFECFVEGGRTVKEFCGQVRLITLHKDCFKFNHPY